MFKKILILVTIISVWAQPGFGFLYELETLDQSAIIALSDDDIIDKYIDVLVEVEASKTFHQTSGFQPKHFKSYKKLLKYRILLLQEIKKRGLEVPSADYLKLETNPKEQDQEKNIE